MSVKALIVDDSPAARKLIGHQLRQLGCEIVGEAETAVDGLRLFEQLRPELITLDLMMPNRNGVDSMALVDTVKRTAPEVGIIVVSSIPFEKLRTDFLEKGVLDYVIKPFNNYAIQRLRVKLRRAFPQLIKIS
jgi:two-component system, chemotaxis family, chemotaxis protein CheY